ncbi:MAG: quinone-dependent dihydroorotate dehydrogenase [Alphaproteobacteria bacterium]|nr:quinone-dependent dihydroorotate dehydrogenase [Alphaproteobacteria bacterium]
MSAAMPFDLATAALRLLAPETAHHLALRAMALGLGPRRPAERPRLAQTLWGRRFPNPLGLAAGLDKDAEAPAAFLAAGFGFVEVGTLTPKPQAGNPRPRLFRLTEDAALINRMGFNNLGLAAAHARLSRRDRKAGIVGVNIGRNKDQTDAVADYVAGVAELGPLADYLTINVSSPNTPGLRALQAKAPLVALIDAAKAARGRLGLADPPPILVKVAPDLTAEEREAVAEVALAHGLDGLIVSNTTLARPPALRSEHRGETGGLSGRPLRDLALAALADFRRLTRGRLPLIGVGGIASGADAYARIRAGASLIQVYTALVYQGPGMVPRLLDDLEALLYRDGFATLAEAVGAGLPSPT